MKSSLRPARALLTCLAPLLAVAPAHALNLQDPGPAQVASAAPMTTADLVAPVALYPDQLLGQVLTISTTPQEVLDLGTWLVDNDSLKGSKAEAAKAAGFSTSAQYLAMFPQVVDNMCQQIDWTTQLGDAYTDDAKKVMAAIQSKRAEAVKAGNLKTSSQLTVTNKKGDDGKSYIEITPTDPQVIYVPTYNPITVYVQSAPAPATVNTTVVVQQQSGVSSGTAVGIGLLSFGVGMAVGASINNSYYPYPSWGYGGMYYGGRPYYPPPYRPPYYPGYHPAYGYHPPANYHWNQVNRQTNITINNNNYYNRVNNNSNNVNRGNNASRPGQISQSNRPGAAGNNNRPGGAGNSNRPGGAGNNTRPGGNDRGYAGGGPGGSGGATQRPTNNASRPSPAASRPAATPRPSTQAARPSPQARPQQSGGAFGGSGGGSGSSARAASSRGHASAGPSRGGGGGGGGGGGRRR